MGTENLFHNKRKARQENEMKRQQASRDSFERVLITCEDSDATPSYLRVILDDLKLTNVEIRPDKKKPDPNGCEWANTPDKVIEYARCLKKKDKGYDKVYCVIDQDKHDYFLAALKTAQENNIAVIVSIPCFEYWLLLHFEYTTRPFQAGPTKGSKKSSNCDKVIAVLNKHLKKHLPGNYKKSKDFFGKHYFSVFKGRQAIAIGHARRRERECQSPSEESAACEKQRQCQLDELEEMNPYTEMHWLIECLMEMKNKKDEDGINNKVLYLCHSTLTKKGWVFPQEEDCDSPGVFVIEEQSGKLGDQYWFNAIHKEKRITLELQKKKSKNRRQIFEVHASIGVFSFKARPSKEPYVGKNSRLQQDSSFWILEALLPERLEEACKQDDFYFIGAVEEEPA
jgi:hypothetical protein